MEYAPIKSFVDAPFFSELGKWKLNEAKLSEESVDITGAMALPLAPGRPPALRLSTSSMASSEPSGLEATSDYIINGKLMNLNTIEQFKELDKLEFQRNVVADLSEKIRSGVAWRQPDELMRFQMITFSDLKKYRFFYWFLFPALSGTNLRLGLISEKEPSAKLNAAISESKQLFFAINEDDDTVSPLSETKGSVGIVDFGSTTESALPWHLPNLAAVLKTHTDLPKVRVYLFRDPPSISARGGVLRSRWIEIDLVDWSVPSKGEGWERNGQGRLLPKLADLSSLMNPLDLADQAVDLNLKLMKWRAAPQINLDAVKECRVLLLGAGTLGCYVARGLLAWGVRTITLVDSGHVSYSNPVRQPLFSHEDARVNAPKAEAAAKALGLIFPGVNAHGLSLEIPMAGHPITSEQRQHADYEQLVGLIESHDVVYLLMDSRESRWLPTVISQGMAKPVINVAIGFDSYLVMRHGVPLKPADAAEESTSDATEHIHRSVSGPNLGCYFCNDVVAPLDSVSRNTLDQMCTVTRPGVAMLASGAAVELFAQMRQHPEGARAPANSETTMGPLPHQLRGFLRHYETMKVWGPAFRSCSGCGAPVVSSWQHHGWEFVKNALNDPEYVTELSGLGELQRQTETLDLLDSADDEIEEMPDLD